MKIKSLFLLRNLNLKVSENFIMIIKYLIFHGKLSIIYEIIVYEL